MLRVIHFILSIEKVGLLLFLDKILILDDTQKLFSREEIDNHDY